MVGNAPAHNARYAHKSTPPTHTHTHANTHVNTCARATAQSSEYTTDSEEEEDGGGGGRRLIKPVFVPKGDREVRLARLFARARARACVCGGGRRGGTAGEAACGAGGAVGGQLLPPNTHTRTRGCTRSNTQTLDARPRAVDAPQTLAERQELEQEEEAAAEAEKARAQQRKVRKPPYACMQGRNADMQTGACPSLPPTHTNLCVRVLACPHV